MLNLPLLLLKSSPQFFGAELLRVLMTVRRYLWSFGALRTRCRTHPTYSK